MAGEHSVEHIAALVSQLPLHARVNVAVVDDAKWTQQDVLLANISNMLASLIYGMSDPKKRGAPPKPIGPSFMTGGDAGKRRLDARVLTIAELNAELSKPRKAVI